MKVTRTCFTADKMWVVLNNISHNYVDVLQVKRNQQACNQSTSAADTKQTARQSKNFAGNNPELLEELQRARLPSQEPG